MSRTLRRRLAWGLFAAGWLVAALVIWLRPPSAPANPPVPSPNGYAFFQSAAQVLPTEINTRYSDLDDDALADLVAASRGALDELRRGLDLECRVPPASTMKDLEPRMVTFSGLKRLAMVQAAAGELAARQGEWDSLMACCTNGLRYGQAASRGGLLIDRLLGNAFEAMAISPLKERVGNLPGPLSRRAASMLASLSATREPLSAVIERETYFAKTAGGLRGRLAWWIVGRRSMATIMSKTQAKDDAIVRELRTLAVRLAARAYEVEHGQLPASAADLVPHYLSALPTDPADGTPLPLPLGSARP